MSDLKAIEVDNEEVILAIKIITDGFKEHKISDLARAAAMLICLDTMRECGIDVRAVQTKQFNEFQ